METPKAIKLYYNSPIKVKEILDQYNDYCTKNGGLVFNLSQRITNVGENDKKVVLVAGISGSTKTFFSELLGSYIPECTIIHMDCFAISKEKRKKRGVFFPENFDFEASFRDLGSIIGGQQTNFPIYCHEDSTYHLNIEYPSNLFILEGIHLHNPSFVRYFQEKDFEIIKISLMVNFIYLQQFTRKERPPPDEVIIERMKEYKSLVYPYSQDSLIKLIVGLDHKLIEYKKEDDLI